VEGEILGGKGDNVRMKISRLKKASSAIFALLFAFSGKEEAVKTKKR